MRIKQISVTGLFGIFNHVIPLKLKDRITILHGLNGLGKTSILKILDGVLNSHYPVLKNSPFASFRIEFSSNTTLEVIKETYPGKKEDKNIEITFNLFKSELKIASYFLEKINQSDDEPSWFKELKTSTSICLIESHKLLSNESTKSVLSVYVEDVKKKLSIFDEIANKLELFRKIINRKFASSYKEMNFSKEKGFVFTTCYPNSSESYSKDISPTDLSSGEQHELVLLYKLLFKIAPNSLVLIDEPELSLHVGWQSQFLEDLQEITELVDLDILMATHSPDIIQDRWDDLTVELKVNAQI